MSSFVFWVTVIFGFEVVCRVICMAAGVEPKRDAFTRGVDTLLGMGIMCWGIYLLAK